MSQGNFNRRIGLLEGDESGPLLLCVGGIHGNEHAGLAAAERVLGALEGYRSRFRGRFVALAGNLTALGRGTRFVDRDLNRQWMAERIGSLKRMGADSPLVEDREQVQLVDALETEFGRAGGPAYFLDLHTSSADGPPFVTIGDTLRNRDFARQLGLPVVLGLEEQIDGALLEYINNQGYVTVGVEAGQHDASTSVDHHEAVLWLALFTAGNLPDLAAEKVERCRRILRDASLGVPRILEVRYRHVVRKDDGFVMMPGFRNFQFTSPGQVVAQDHSGPIRTHRAAGILLPLYQAQGNDGFFIVRKVHPLWMRVSALFRRLGLPRLAAWLPGIRPHPDMEETLLVNTRIARFFPLQVLHLLGFRKRRWHGNILLVTRRKHDLTPPPIPRSGQTQTSSPTG